MQKIGRNDLCPCGSGKKYKFCCLHVPFTKEILPLSPKSEDDDSFDAASVHFQHGSCDLSNSEIDSRFLHDLSAVRLLYEALLFPQLEQLATSVTRRFINRGREEASQIRKATSLEELIALMHQQIDPLNHDMIITRLVEHGREAADRILQEMERPVETEFLELGIRVIHRCGFEHNNKLRYLIEKGPRKAYTVSLLCMLLGFTGITEHLALLWTYYKYLKQLFPSQTYSDGPLLGLIEIRARQIEKEKAKGHQKGLFEEIDP